VWIAAKRTRRGLEPVELPCKRGRPPSAAQAARSAATAACVRLLPVPVRRTGKAWTIALLPGYPELDWHDWQATTGKPEGRQSHSPESVPQEVIWLPAERVPRRVQAPGRLGGGGKRGLVELSAMTIHSANALRAVEQMQEGMLRPIAALMRELRARLQDACTAARSGRSPKKYLEAARLIVLEPASNAAAARAVSRFLPDIEAALKAESDQMPCLEQLLARACEGKAFERAERGQDVAALSPLVDGSRDNRGKAGGVRRRSPRRR
jgi:hypothetical protein